MHRLFDHSLTALPRCPTVCVSVCVERESSPCQRQPPREPVGETRGERKQIRLLPILPTERPVFQGRVHSQLEPVSVFTVPSNGR